MRRGVFVTDEHRIRLRGPWKMTTSGNDAIERSIKLTNPVAVRDVWASPSAITFSRHFNWVAPLDPGAAVRLCLEGFTGITKVSLNGTDLATPGSETLLNAIDITERLKQSNTLTIAFAGNAMDHFGNVALQIVHR